MLLFLHGSSRRLDVGTTLKPRDDAYEQEWGKTNFYYALELNRPVNALSHKDAVFLTVSCEDVGLAGGCDDYIFLVEPKDPARITRHDLNWSSQISCLIGDGYEMDSPEVQEAALNYWSGKPHPDEPVWEYLCTGATIKAISEDAGMDEVLDQAVAESHQDAGFIATNEQGGKREVELLTAMTYAFNAAPVR